MKKRLIAIMLIMMLAVFYTGCGSSGSDASEEPDSSVAAEESATEDEGAKDDVVVKTADPITNGVVPDNSKVSDGFNEVKKGGMVFKVPNYYGILPDMNWEDNLAADNTLLYAARGENLGMLDFHASQNANTISYDDFIDEYSLFMELRYSAMENSDGVTDFSAGEYYPFLLSNGMIAAAGSYTFKMNDIDILGRTVLINNTDDNTFVYVDAYQAAGAEYDYTVEYEKMVMGAELE